jgi:hypothetical protein
MTRVASITAKSPRLALWSRRESRLSAPPKQRDPAEQAAALQRSETRYRRVREAAEASFLMNGGRYL